jgi:hypothetical protein
MATIAELQKKSAELETKNAELELKASEAVKAVERKAVQYGQKQEVVEHKAVSPAEAAMHAQILLRS